jgi:hypothetical protein
MAIASSNYQRLGQLVGVALRQGSSWQAIARMIQEAVEKVKQTRCYSQKDFDIVCLIDIVSGPKLGYAMSHALGLPSVTAAMCHFECRTLMPSVGPVEEQSTQLQGKMMTNGGDTRS